MTFPSWVVSALNRSFRLFGYRITRVEGCIDARTTIREAKRRGQSVREYVEAIWGQEGATERVIDHLRAVGCLAPCQRVLEIGPGTGRYLELVLRHAAPQQYDIYETAEDWARWLAHTYAPPVVHQPTDGFTLQATRDGSCQLVHAHGVFVYLGVLHAFQYFLEMIRVCASGGFVAFDFYPAEDFDHSTITRWLRGVERYPVLLPRAHVATFFSARQCHLIHEFDSPFGHGQSHYVVFRKSPRPDGPGLTDPVPFTAR